MGDRSGIQWTDATWNPVTGCRKISPGCTNCYAKDVADRFWPAQYPPVPTSGSTEDPTVSPTRPRRFTDVQCHPERLGQPFRWRKPRRVFVNSMSDLFHEDVPFDFIRDVFEVMWRAQQHTFQVLTKRPERMREAVDWILSRAEEAEAAGLPGMSAVPWGPPPNVWLGVSVEDQAAADARIPVLLDTPAAVRFVSAEPLLGPVDLRRIDPLRGVPRGPYDPKISIDALTGHVAGPDDVLPRLDWVIVGGESGPKARPMDLAWARALVEQCRGVGVAPFVKQLGRRPVWRDRAGVQFEARLRDSHGGDPEEWPADLRIREFPSPIGAAHV